MTVGQIERERRGVEVDGRIDVMESFSRWMFTEATDLRYSHWKSVECGEPENIWSVMIEKFVPRLDLYLKVSPLAYVFSWASLSSPSLRFTFVNHKICCGINNALAVAS